jgi:hypothetical protein
MHAGKKTPSVVEERLGKQVDGTISNLYLFLVQPKHAQIRQRKLQVGLALGFGLKTRNKTNRHWKVFYYA